MTLIDHELTTFGKGDIDLDTPKPYVSHQRRASIQEYETGLIAPLSVHNTIIVHQTRWLAVIFPRSPHGNLTLSGYISYQPCRFSKFRSGIIDRFDPIRATLGTSLWTFRKLFDLLFRMMGLDFFCGWYLFVWMFSWTILFSKEKKYEPYTKYTILISRHFNLERGLVLNDLFDLTLNITYLFLWYSSVCKTSDEKKLFGISAPTQRTRIVLLDSFLLK